MIERRIDFNRFQDLPLSLRKIISKRFDSTTAFEDLNMPYTQDNLSTYGIQVSEFHYPFTINKVWDSFINENPSKLWNGSLLQFVLAYSVVDNIIYYFDDKAIPHVQEGMQIYASLNVFGPRIIIGFKIIKIDSSKKELHICYLEGGLYKGIQKLRFEAKNEHTYITHESLYSGGIFFSDLLYLYFHQKTVSEFHLGIKQMLQVKEHQIHS